MTSIIFVCCYSQIVLAAPFCTVNGYGTQCFYFKYSECLRNVGDGACIINQNEVHGQPGGAPFCVVQSFGAQCFYYNRQSCQQAAQTNDGLCVANS